MSAEDASPRRVERVEPRHFAALVELFDRAGSSCFCRWWYFGGDKNAWLARLAHQPAGNRDELRAALAARPPPLALVALVDGRVVGWLNLARAASVPKLHEQRPYRGLTCLAGPRADVAVIACLLVDPSQRREGIAHELVQAAVEAARAEGLTAIDAFPRGGEGDMPDELAWTGTVALYRAHGFEVVHDLAPSPVLRRAL